MRATRVTFASDGIYVCIYIYIGAPSYRKSRKELSEIFLHTLSFLFFQFSFFSPFSFVLFFFWRGGNVPPARRKKIDREKLEREKKQKKQREIFLGGKRGIGDKP